MPRLLSPLPDGADITARGGPITAFFRLRWQELLDAFQLAATRANRLITAQTDAIGTTTIYTPQQAGLYRLSWYFRKTVADGAASSLTMTFGWSDLGAALTVAGAALTTDATTAVQQGSVLLRADALSSLTFSVAYASTTPNRMQYDVGVTVEELA